ncbi:hypothetical protein ASPCADRAFT_204847 [Aspergillus carbonarius ITEM 5010]|uniref:Protein kinase domain-containing protein n=1 Tax=Aspergillus carbonarius (strain ITEM 5010) TaxID=602072 RepID=A0A1R3RXM2_ASPC5|nr:hypothetical protein ASPCADRAFT_204847 [Aspergillus carbonarius ITEM 5010]
MCAHLDLKPDNILIRKADDSIVGKWMISDFGISAIEPHRDGSRPALSVGYRYRQLTIETDPKHRAGTYLPPEAIDRGATTAVTDKVGRQSDIWAYGCIFSEVLAWAIGRSVVVNELAESRGKNARSDTFWEESSGQNLSPQPTGYKLREPVAAWLDKVGNSPERVLRYWAQTIKDVLITDKHARPNAAKLVEYVKKVCSSCDQPSEAVNDNDRQPTPDYTPPPSSLSSGSSDLGQSPEQRSKPIWYGTKYGIASYLSRTAWQGKVPGAVVSQDKIEIIELDLSREEVKLIDEISLSPKWEDASIVIEGQYFAAWGYCKAEKKRTLRIGDRNSNFEPNLPVSQGLVCSVAVSCGGIFALVRDKDIVLLSWPCTSASSVHCRLTIPSPLDQTFTHAIFNEGGDLLFAWARGQKQESLYVWNVQREIVSVPDFVTHYSLRYRFYLDTQVIPYKNGRGCILAGDHNKYLAVSLERPSNTELPGIDRLDETIDVVVSCLVGDDQLLGLVSNRGFRTRLCLRRYKVDHGEDRDILILQDQELCNIKIPKEFKSANLMRAYQEEETITVVLWHGTRILILKGIKRI